MSKAKKIIYWVATVWLSLGMVSTGFAQIIKRREGPGAIDSTMHLGYPVYLLALIGLLKILGSVVVLVPRVPVLKEWHMRVFSLLWPVQLILILPLTTL